MQIHARKIIIFPSIILPVFLLRAGQGNHRIQTSTSLFCPFIILSFLLPSKFQDKIMGGQNDFRLPVCRSRTPLWFRKSSVVRGRMMEGRIIGCKSMLAKLLFFPSIILPVFLLRAGQSDHRIQTSTSLFCPFIILSFLLPSKF